MRHTILVLFKHDLFVDNRRIDYLVTQARFLTLQGKTTDGCSIYKHTGHDKITFIVVPETHPLFNIGVIDNVVPPAAISNDIFKPFAKHLRDKYSQPV